MDSLSLSTSIPDQTFLVTIREGALDSECDDDSDNDTDGDVDCLDSDCAGIAPCS